jgi:8-oxo-dGTP pyrophosphatase MutT (NUDIX family)
VRALIVDPANRVLLVRFTDEFGDWWSLPGGGVEPGESDLEGLTRELSEEVGLHDFELGPLIWTREHWLVNPRRFGGQSERIYLVRAEPFDPAPTFTVEELAAEGVGGVGWLSLEELTSVTTGPRTLAALVRDLIERGPPPEPLALHGS